MRLAVFALALALGLAACAAQHARAPGPASQPDTEVGDRAKIHTELAAGYLDRGQLGIALQEIEKALAVRSDFAPAYNVQALIYMELGEHARAEENFRRALSLAPSSSETRNDFGRFLCERGRFDEADQQFGIVLKDPLYSGTDRTLVNAGLCAKKAGDDARALAFLDRAVKLNPSLIPPRTAAADIAFRAGRLTDASRYLAGIADAPEATPDALWLALKVERRLGDRSLEARLGRELRTRFPDSSETQRLLSGRYE